MHKKKHDWNNLQNYLLVHERVLRQYASSFTNLPHYKTNKITEQWLELSVVIHFHHKSIKLEVEKTVEIRSFGKGRESAKTFAYTYNASDLTGNYFRYCSPHLHRKYHHKHVYDSNTRVEIKPPLRLGDDAFPHINEVIDEILAT